MMFRAILLLFLLVNVIVETRAQLDDTQLRSEVKLEWVPAKKWSAYGSYRLDLNQNMTGFRRSNMEVGADYNVLKWLRVGAAYRFVTSFTRDFHRFELSLSARQSFFDKRFQVAYTSMVQSNMDYINREYFSANDPMWVYRNRLRLRYSPSKRWNLQVQTELFARTRQKESDFYRLRSGMGVGHSFNKQHQLYLGYFYQNEFNIRNARNIQAVELEYTYTLDTRKKKKKK